MGRERDVFARSYRPQLERHVRRVVNREAARIRAALELDKPFDFIYAKEVPMDLKRFVRPLQWTFGESIISATANETGLALSINEAGLVEFRQAYIEVFSTRYVQGHGAQLRALATKEEILERIDQWVKTSAEKVAMDEAVRMNNAVFQDAKFSRGQCTTWRVRGDTCPYCKSLNQRKICNPGSGFEMKN